MLLPANLRFAGSGFLPRTCSHVGRGGVSTAKVPQGVHAGSLRLRARDGGLASPSTLIGLRLGPRLPDIAPAETSTDKLPAPGLSHPA